MHDVLTPSEAADYLQVSTATVYRLLRAKKLTASRVGRTYQIPRAGLDAFIAADGNRDARRERLIRQFLAIADRNPGVDSDTLLEELEQEDAARRDRAPV